MATEESEETNVENPDDPFDRQRCIPKFKHEIMEQQVVTRCSFGRLRDFGWIYRFVFFCFRFYVLELVTFLSFCWQKYIFIFLGGLGCTIAFALARLGVKKSTNSKIEWVFSLSVSSFILNSIICFWVILIDRDTGMLSYKDTWQEFFSCTWRTKNKKKCHEAWNIESLQLWPGSFF